MLEESISSIFRGQNRLIDFFLGSKAGVSSGLKHGLAGGGVGRRGEGVLGYLRVHKVHSCNVKVY